MGGGRYLCLELRFDLWSILHRPNDFRRKLGLVQLPAVRAVFALGAVFGNFYLYRRDVKPLPSVVVVH
jgi:hypothetical protein